MCMNCTFVHCCACHITQYTFTRETQNIRVNEKSYRLRMGAYRDGVKMKGDMIGMGL